MTDDKNKKLAILGLRPGAKQIEIKNAFRNLSLIYHPDNKETGSARKFIEIKSAYDELFDKILFEKELKDLKKDPKAYSQARTNFPIVFEDDDENGTTYSSTAVKPYVPKPKTPVNSKSKHEVEKKNNDSNLSSFCLGGIVVAAIIALFTFPQLFLFAIILGVGAYLLLK
ncbi:J domain-containing protein [uncultured Methanobrevibacter sp.]|uniref:J domain-containing protein n=1 Tax=uncultured Methanobrevibacter sp. TaxID=253161 RepID=UPI0025DD8724|nr:J domain-containing protein [uncultured Methanobrevibacter sp.]